MSQWRILLLIFPFLFGIKGRAQQKPAIATDRPNQTSAASTIQPGELQIESGIIYLTTSLNLQETRDDLFALNTIWRIGIVKRFELRIVTQPQLFWQNKDGTVIYKSAGMNDLEVGFKVNIVDGSGGNTQVGFISQVILPTGSEGVSFNKYGSVNRLAVKHSLSDKHNLAYNIGYDYFGTDLGILFGSLAWSISLSEKLGVFVEPYGYYEISLEDFLASADAGFTYLLTNNMQLDYVFGVGMNHRMNFHTLGFSIRLPN